MKILETKGLGKKVLALVLLLLLTQVSAAGPDRTPEQKRFLQAEKALSKQQWQRFRKLADSLRDYPLFPYLEYEALIRRLERASSEEVQEFLHRHADTPLAQRLRSRWLDLLAKRGSWTQYLRFYEKNDGSIARQCHYLHALLQTGRKKQAFSGAKRLWLHGRSRPKACDAVFRAWRKSGGISVALVWERIDRAMRLGETRLVRYLKKLLPKKDHGWIDLWLQIRHQPQLALASERLKQAHPFRDRLLAYAVIRQARRDPLEALALWERLKKRYTFDETATRRVVRALVRRLLREEDPAAWRFFEQLHNGDAGLQETRILAALYRGRWEEACAWITQLPQAERNTERWRYWRARSLEQLGKRKEAETIYRRLAAERSFYGFLAADHVGVPYNLAHAPAPVGETLMQKVARKPAIVRARELIALERWSDARREWRFATARMSKAEIMAAAKLAQSWGWNDQAIFTLARTGYWDDLELRFPLVHRETVERQAQERDLDVSWVFGVIRQESAFNATVRSRAGAIGLMQLMPATARYVARKLLGLHRSPSRHDLVQPKVNIRLGTTYLSDVLGQLEQNPVLATAAYNAGPHHVSRWLPDHSLDADLWIELIPFAETRNYVKRVFTYAVIYDRRRNKEITRLSQRLRPIAGSSPQRTAQQQHNRQATL